MLKDAIGGFRAALSFLTTLPVGVGEGDYDRFTERVYLFVLVGIAAGLILALAGLVFQALLPPALIAIILVACIYLLTGINHIDGFSDMGDGVIACGPVEKKVKAMKDVHAGAGGVLFIVMDVLLLYSAISVFVGRPGYFLVAVLFIAEVCAKVSSSTIISFGKSLHTGMGSIVIAGAKKPHYYAGIIVALAVCMFVVPVSIVLWALVGMIGNFSIPVLANLWVKTVFVGMASVITAILTGFAVRRVANSNFGGVNGDVIGAANEAGRFMSLIVTGTLLWILF